MAVHDRQAIREAVVAQLAGKTAAAERVFKTREVPWRTAELPGIAVYANEETAEPASITQRDLRRTLSVAVLAVVSISEDVDDALDALALEIEMAMAADPQLGGAAFDSWLTGTKIEMTNAQGRLIGCVELTFDVRYYTAAPAA